MAPADTFILVVNAAILLGALAAVLVPNFLTSRLRAKQKASAVALTDWSQELEEYAQHRGTFPRPGYSGPVAAIAPMIPKRLTLVDGWGYPILYHSSGQHYALRSTGRDGVNDHMIARATTASYDDDILLVNGGFTRVPAAAGPPDGDNWDVTKYGECASCHPHRISHS